MLNTVQVGAVIAEQLFKLALNYTLCAGISSPVAVPVYVDGDPYIDDLGIETLGSEAMMSLGLGADGGFYKEPIRYFPLGITDPSAVCVGDLNGDGLKDLVARGPSGFSFALADGRSGFGPVVDFPSCSDSIAVKSDLNGDGFLDLIMADNSNKVSVQFGNEVGGFGPANTFFVPNGARSIAPVDFTGDGKIDIVVADKDNFDKFSVLVNQGLSANSASTVSETSLPSAPLIAIVAVVSLIVVLAVAYYLYTKSQQYKSVKKSEDTSDVDTQGSSLLNSPYTLYQRGTALKGEDTGPAANYSPSSV